MKTLLIFVAIIAVYLVIVFLRGAWKEKRTKPKKEKPISPPSGGEAGA